MDSPTALEKPARLNPYGKALRRERIFARLRAGRTYDDIAREERVTPRRVRQIVSDALARRRIDGGSDHAMLQLMRLEQALRVSAEAVARGEVEAIGPYLKVLDRFDRYRVPASANPVYDEDARKRLFAKLNRVAARLMAEEAAQAAPAAEAPGAREAGEAKENDAPDPNSDFQP